MAREESWVFLPTFISAILILVSGLAAYHFAPLYVTYLPFGTAIGLVMLSTIIVPVYLVCVFGAVACSIGTHSQWRRRISIALLIPPSLILIGLATIILFSAANVTDRSELADATSKDKFFAMVATDTNMPQLCDKVSPNATISSGGGWFDNSKDYLRSKCYYDVAVKLDDSSLCSNVRYLKVRGANTGNYSENLCIQELQSGTTYSDWTSPYGLSTISILQELGYTKEEVSAYYNTYVGGEKQPNPSDNDIAWMFYSRIVLGSFKSSEERSLQEEKADRDIFIQRVIALPVSFSLEQPSEISRAVGKVNKTTIDIPVGSAIVYTTYPDDSTKNTIGIWLLDGHTSSDAVTVFIIDKDYRGDFAWDAVLPDNALVGPLPTDIEFQGNTNRWRTHWIGYEHVLSANGSYTFRVAVYDSATHELLKSSLITCVSGSLCTLSDD